MKSAGCFKHWCTLFYQTRKQGYSQQDHQKRRDLIHIKFSKSLLCDNATRPTRIRQSGIRHEAHCNSPYRDSSLSVGTLSHQARNKPARMPLGKKMTLPSCPLPTSRIGLQPIKKMYIKLCYASASTDPNIKPPWMTENEALGNWRVLNLIDVGCDGYVRGRRQNLIADLSDCVHWRCVDQ